MHRALHSLEGEREGKRSSVSLEVADIIVAHGEALARSRCLSSDQLAVLRDLLRCRTSELSGHREQCTSCGYERIAYNSCRNRHCPKCQSLRQAQWVEERLTRMLPVKAFHVVFTLPDELRAVALENRTLIFDLLFSCAAETLLELGRDKKHLGAELGITSVLHTWTRELTFHHHVHCIVTAGGLFVDDVTGQDKWVHAKPDFLFHVRVMGELFRGKFMQKLCALYERGELTFKGPAKRFASKPAFLRVKNKLYLKRWVVYAKEPFGGPTAIFQYLGRYTHRVGISNQRLESLENGIVTFRTKGSSKAKLPACEFLGRFVLHVLPKRFFKIRHHGLMASANVHGKLERARAALVLEGAKKAEPVVSKSKVAKNYQDLMLALTGLDVRRCPVCVLGVLVRAPLQADGRKPALKDSS